MSTTEKNPSAGGTGTARTLKVHKLSPICVPAHGKAAERLNRGLGLKRTLDSVHLKMAVTIRRYPGRTLVTLGFLDAELEAFDLRSGNTIRHWEVTDQ